MQQNTTSLTIPPDFSPLNQQNNTLEKTDCALDIPCTLVDTVAQKLILDNLQKPYLSKKFSRLVNQISANVDNAPISRT